MRGLTPLLASRPARPDSIFSHRPNQVDWYSVDPYTVELLESDNERIVGITLSTQYTMSSLGLGVWIEYNTKVD